VASHKLEALCDWQERRLTPHLGVEAYLNINKASADDFSRLLKLLGSHKLVLIRNQTVTPASYLRFARGLGKPWNPDKIGVGTGSVSFAVDGISQISRLSNHGGQLGDRQLDWHIDFSYHPKNLCPGRILYAKTIPRANPSLTNWVNLAYGWRESLTAQQRKVLSQSLGEYDGGVPTKWGSIILPVLRKHPFNKQEWPCIDHVFFQRFIGMPTKKNQKFKAEILEKLLSPVAMYSHEWKEGDIILFDNSGTIHNRARIEGTEERTLWQITLNYRWPLCSKKDSTLLQKK